MTKITKTKVKCAKCKTESNQLNVYSVNFSLGKKNNNEKLIKFQQKCPNCGYEARDISKDIQNK